MEGFGSAWVGNTHMEAPNETRRRPGFVPRQRHAWQVYALWKGQIALSRLTDGASLLTLFQFLEEFGQSIQARPGAATNQPA